MTGILTFSAAAFADFSSIQSIALSETLNASTMSVIILIPFARESPPKVLLAKNLPAAKPRVSSTLPTQNSPRSPTAPFLIPVNTSSSVRCACQASVLVPRYGDNASAACVTRYDSMTWFDVSFKILERVAANLG